MIPQFILGFVSTFDASSVLWLRVLAGLLVTLQFFSSNCDCDYILFTKLPWPGDSEGTFRSSSQAPTCPPVYHKRRRLYTVPFNAERQAGKLWIPIFIVFGMTRLGIEPESTASVADALSTRLLSGRLS